MITCFPIWTAAAPVARRVTHHIGLRIARHSIRHAALAPVRIFCVATPVWLAAPTPAAAPPLPVVLPPPMLPWPEGDEVPLGWGGDDLPGGAMPGASDVPGAPMPVWQPGQGTDQPSVLTFVDRAVPPVEAFAPPIAPVPEPSSAAVLAVGVVVLAWLRRAKQ
jgi:hypothetical protein